MVVPFIWMILTSLHTFGESIRVPPVIWPARPQWSNFVKVTHLLPFFHLYVNTVVTTIARTLGHLVFCSLAAYAFARLEFPGRGFLFLLTIAISMVPGQLYLIPQYVLMKDFGWLNSLQALIMPGLFGAFGTFLLRQFFMGLPKELEEAAYLDGCNVFQVYLRVMLPLAKPGLVALAIITMLASWNDLLWPLIVNTDVTKMTLASGLPYLQGEYVTDYPVLMAGALLSVWPMIVMFFIFQKQFVEGIAVSGIKG
ncbi:MAG: carbohydrate ABC transporter permease [Alicyclobacillus sp.]|nr:carbohydrate ABC transporter permease [Alicyclobacillus sp.]